MFARSHGFVYFFGQNALLCEARPQHYREILRLPPYSRRDVQMHRSLTLARNELGVELGLLSHVKIGAQTSCSWLEQPFRKRVTRSWCRSPDP